MTRMKSAMVMMAACVPACAVASTGPLNGADSCAFARPNFGVATDVERNLFAYDVDAPLNLQKSLESMRNGVEESRISFDSPGGGRVTGLLFDPVLRSSLRPGIVLMHGLPGNARNTAAAAQVQAEHGAVVIAIDAPFARRGGQPVRFNAQDRAEQIQLIKDLQRAVDVLRAQTNVDKERIAYYGISYGGAMGVLFAGIERRIKAAVLVVADGGLVSHFTGPEDAKYMAGLSCATRTAWLDAMTPIEPIRFLANASPTALLLQSGRWDNLVPAADAQAVHTAAPQPRTIRWYDAGHGLNQQAVLDRLDWLHETIGIDAVASSSPKKVILPAPTGSYGIGVIAHAVTDPRRREIFTLDTSDIRRFPVFVYYPVAKGTCAPSVFFPPKLAEVYTAEFRYQAGFDRTVRAHACPDAPIVAGSNRFPVILFSHGLGHTNFSYRSIIEDLVSHGNVVVAVDHTHGGRAVHFPDGELVMRDNSRWFTGVDPERNLQAAKEYPRFWAEDTRLVIDMLGNASSAMQRQIQGRVDTSRLIYAGHSFGGITAVYAAMIDARIKGAVNLDGLIIGRYPLPVTTDAPLLVLNSKDRNELQTYMSAARVLPVARSNHMTFSDFIWLHEQVGMGPPPPSDMSGEQGIALTRKAIRAFLPCVFERNCKELDAQLSEIKGSMSPAPQQPKPPA